MPAALLPHRRLLRLVGRDARALLHALSTADLREPPPPGCLVLAAFCSPQGRWMADAFVAAGPDASLVLDVDADQAGWICAHLERFRLRRDVQVLPDPRHVVAGWGMAPDGALPDPRHPEAGWRLHVADAADADATREDWDAHRIRLGLPDGPRDLDAGRTLPLETGEDALGAIGWTKGCWPGQEVNARLRWKGGLRRRLAVLAFDGPAPPRGTPVLDAGGQPLGVLGSAAGGHALAILALPHPPPDAFLQAGGTAMRLTR
jgi:folate-binding protein YgfZ